MDQAPPPVHRGNGEDDDPVPRRASAHAEAELDAALADYRDRTYATWTGPDGAEHIDVSPLTDRRIEAALRAAPSPARPRPRRGLRIGLAASAAAVGVLAGTVALSTLREGPVSEPENGVLLAAATPGGDRGPYADGAALTRCLEAAAVPAGERVVLGTGPADVKGTQSTVLLLRGSRLGDVRVLAVRPACAQGEASAVLVNRVLPGAGTPSPGTP